MSEGLIVVSAAGMVCALGTDWRTATAAARSGLRRAGPVDDAESKSEVDGENEPVVGHQASLLTHGFEGPARLLRLLAGALGDLVEQEAHLAIAGPDIGVVLVLGSPFRHLSASARIADKKTAKSLDKALREAQSAREGGRVGENEGVPPPRIAHDRQALVDAAARLAGMARSPRLISVLDDDDVAGLVALDHAEQALLRQGHTEVIVIAGDCLLDHEVLDWLQWTGRLKSSGVPAGLEPGEAAVALLLRHDTSDKQGTVRLGGKGFALEPNSFADGQTSTGQGLADAMTRAIGGFAAEPGWIVSDHNGEPDRANDLALALVRCASRCPGWNPPVVTYPAISFGDTGAARPLVGVCTALAAFERKYAPARQALIIGSADSRRRASVLLTRN